MRFYPVLLTLLFDRWSYTDAGVRDRTHLRIFTRRSLERMLARHGLALERMERNYRLIEDQSEIGRLGALATRVPASTIAPLLFRDLMAFQYIAVARPRPAPACAGLTMRAFSSGLRMRAARAPTSTCCGRTRQTRRHVHRRRRVP